MYLVLNSKHVPLTGVEPHTTLLDFLRSNGFTGAKEGCAEGECGACAVVMVRPNGSGGSRYVPINSCLMLAGMAAGQEILTVEGLAQGKNLHEAQTAMSAGGGSQCGYCTPGFVMSLFAEQYRPGRKDSCDPHALSGNLCRCTGYRPILDAARSLGMAPRDGFRARLSQPAPALAPIDTGDFLRPDSLAGCLELLKQFPSAQPISGGTDLMVEANLRGRRFSKLIGVEAIPDLRVFRESSGQVQIGAGLTLSEIEALWTGAPRIVEEWFPLFASPLIRNRATLGGNLATASPIGDAAPLLLALGSELRIAGPGGERIVPLTSFFESYRRTALGPGELIVSIVVPKPFPPVARFYKAAKRRADDISTVAAAFAVKVDEAGRVAEARIAFGGVAATPLRLFAAEAELIGQPWDETTIRNAQRAIRTGLSPMSDHRGSVAYRLALAQSLLEKFYVESEPAEVPA
jgi:xanthine dehydrogenase small subunit